MTADSGDAMGFEALLRQMALARNAPAVRRLADDHGLSREELAAFLRQELARQQEEGGSDRLGPRYDVSTGEYSTLAEWVERVVSGR